VTEAQAWRYASRIAYWLFVYSTFATLVPYVLAALWAAGGSTIPLAAGSARESAFAEAAILVIPYTAAPTVLVSLAPIIWGLRIAAPQTGGH